MKKTTLLVALFCSGFAVGQENAILGINFGMTKSEIKKEFNRNKEMYKNIDLGGYYWRFYYQNNTYSPTGGMTSIKLIPKGGGLYGLPEHESKIVFESLINQLTQDGYAPEGANIKSDNYFEFKPNETYTLGNIEKGKSVYVGTPVAGGNIYLNLVIGKLQKKKSKKSVL